VPASNVALKVVADLDSHPVRELVAAGVQVTVKSDDPPMFATTLNNEYAIVARLLGLDEEGIADLARTAVEASFLDDAGKQRLRSEIDAYLATTP
jgi:aminodeoxyfutalosine deaminase